MKKLIFFVALSLIVVLNNSCRNSIAQQKENNFKDGTFEGISRSRYTDEPFYAKVELTIAQGVISDVNFTIRDSMSHEFFDGNYEKHYTGNDEYINQCRNDWKGVQLYPGILLKKQDIDKVDAVSGATWSCNMFKAATKEALKNAKK